MRAFVQLRQMLASLARRLAALEKKYDAQFKVVFDAIRELMTPPPPKEIQYSDEPIGDIKIVADFLPSPEELALKGKNTKVTISLSSESIAYFKKTAKVHKMQYQKMIRQLLDEYVAHQKGTNK